MYILIHAFVTKKLAHAVMSSMAFKICVVLAGLRPRKVDGADKVWRL